MENRPTAVPPGSWPPLAQLEPREDHVRRRMRAVRGSERARERVDAGERAHAELQAAADAEIADVAQRHLADGERVARLWRTLVEELVLCHALDPPEESIAPSEGRRRLDEKAVEALARARRV